VDAERAQTGIWSREDELPEKLQPIRRSAGGPGSSFDKFTKIEAHRSGIHHSRIHVQFPGVRMQVSRQSRVSRLDKNGG